MKKLMLAFAALAVVLGAKAEAETVIFVNTTDQSVTDPARYWNKVPLFSGNQAQKTYTLKDKGTNTSSVVAWVLQPSAGKSSSALQVSCTGDAAEFAKLSTGCKGVEPFSAEEGWNGTTRRPAMCVRLTGLDPAKYYAFTFYGSRKADTRKIYKTRYSVTGTTSGSATLDNSGNSTKVAKVVNILPSAEGFAEIVVRGTDDSTSQYGFWQGLKIESSSVLSLSSIPPVREWFVDAYGTPGADSKRSWNAVDFTGENKKSLVDSLGRATDVQLAVTTNLPSQLTNGKADLTYTGAAAEFNAARQGSKANTTLFGCGVTFNGYYAPYIGATVSGLDPAKRYAVTFVGTRNTGTENVVGLYCVIGTTTASATLNAKANASKVAAVPAVAPRADGTIDLRISADESNDHPSKFYYLVALKISEYYPEDARWASAKATDGGSVAVTVGGKDAPTEGWFENGATLTATATPDDGWKFVAWTADGMSAPVTTETIEISAAAGQAANWTAVFEKDEAYTVGAAYFDAHGTPSSDGKTWNKIQTQLFSHNGRLTGIRSSANAYTPIVITVDQEVGGMTTGATPSNSSASKSLSGDAAPFKAAMTDGVQLFMSMDFNTVINTLQTSFVVAGLNPARLYTFKFCASRTGAGSNVYDTLYRAAGANEVWTRYNPADNTTKIATLANVRPTAEGTVRIEFGAGPNNNNANNFTYLGAFSIEGDLAVSVPETAKRILWFGNSFSIRGDIPKKVEDLAVLAGFDRPVIVADLAGGKDLAYHIGEVTSNPRNNVTANALYHAGTNGWDDVVIQGYSTEATHIYSPLPDAAEGFIANAKTLFDNVTASSRGANARAILYETWARQPENAEFYPSKFADASAMQGEITANYELANAAIKAAYGRKRVETARVGTAFGRLDFDKPLYDSDLYHQGPLGQDLIAMVIFNRIYGVFVDGLVTYEAASAAGWTTASEADWNRIARAAHAVSAKPGLFIILK